MKPNGSGPRFPDLGRLTKGLNQIFPSNGSNGRVIVEVFNGAAFTGCESPVGYVNPFAHAQVVASRIDQGVDYGGSGPIDPARVAGRKRLSQLVRAECFTGPRSLAALGRRVPTLMEEDAARSFN